VERALAFATARVLDSRNGIFQKPQLSDKFGDYSERSFGNFHKSFSHLFPGLFTIFKVLEKDSFLMQKEFFTW